MKVNLEFHECEHNADLENYLSDLRDSGADIISSNLDYEEETAEVVIEVVAYGIFLNIFEDTDSYEFSSLCN
jgi:hypothetical protein